MPGLRVLTTDPTMRNGTLKVPIPKKTPKGRATTVTLQFDDAGTAIVSQGVWDDMVWAAQQFDNNIGLLILNEVPDPPTQIIDGQMVDARPTFVKERDAIKQIAPEGVIARIIPGRPPTIIT